MICPPSRVPRPASSPPTGGLPIAVLRAAPVLATATNPIPPTFLPASGVAANLLPYLTVRRHRRRIVGHGRGFCISPLRLLLRFGNAFHGKASVRGVSDSRRSHSASLRITSSVAAFIHPCPENAAAESFLPYPSASTDPVSFFTGPDHASLFSTKQTAKNSSHRTRSVGQR